tara:strand:- start:175 stop:954 length:780 start_codon:yes stop_codon:yes gene_type:complete
MSETITVKINSGVETIVLNRPDSYNAFNREMALALQKAIDEGASNNTVRAILITGKGKAFSSGQDLKEATDPEGPGLNRILLEHFNPIIRKIRKTPKPVVVAVNGIAAGAGANLALVGDVVIASESASFVQAFSKIGLIPDSGGTLTLPRLVGFAKASAWMITAEKIGAQEALASGMIYKVFPDDKFYDKALEITESLAKKPTRAFAGIKEAINKSTFYGLDEQLEAERAFQVEMGETHDFKEGVSAFIEKRNPKFKGE